MGKSDQESIVRGVELMTTVLEEAKKESIENINILKSKMFEAYKESELASEICVYVCGSLGRLEMTKKTDLDLFFINKLNTDDRNDNTSSNLINYLFFAELYKINNELGFQKPSKKGLYWIFTPKRDLLEIGSPYEDSNNGFTARMLLILESKPIYNEPAYNQLIKEVVDRYFCDFEKYQEEFYPLFLMNDILRYWYTLTLNYEYRRDSRDDDNTKNWKRLKLKYSRLITCFSMIASLYKEKISPDYILECIKMTPFERLYAISEDIPSMKSIIKNIEKEYEWFIKLREQESSWWNSTENKTIAFEKADIFHKLLVKELMQVVSRSNMPLKDKTDSY